MLWKFAKMIGDDTVPLIKSCFLNKIKITENVLIG